MTQVSAPSLANNYHAEHISVLIDSFHHYTGRNLVDPSLSKPEAAREIFYAPFVVVSHDTAADPVFNYGNQTALTLFEMTWPEFIALPSRQSAEPPNQEERAILLNTVSKQGYIDNYSGIRISKGGQRFVIEQVTVWNLRDRHDSYQGQAAIYSSWTYL